MRACLDALIFLANPMEKDTAHITIRGPYSNRGDVPDVPGDITGSLISVCGVDRFFVGRQNTVYLACGSQYIEKYWRKPDYPYNPHITIYDGASREFAERLYATLSQHRMFLTVTAGDVVVRRSVKGQRSLDLWLNVDLARIASVAGEHFALLDAEHMPVWRRLALIDRVCTRLMGPVRNSRSAHVEHGKYLSELLRKASR